MYDLTETRTALSTFIMLFVVPCHCDNREEVAANTVDLNRKLVGETSSCLFVQMLSFKCEIKGRVIDGRMRLGAIM